jgi:sulfate/thiosulfate transport system permease protein
VSTIVQPSNPAVVNRAAPDSGSRAIRAMALTYLIFLLVLPVLVIIQDGLKEGLAVFWNQVTRPVALHALWLTLWTSAVMTLINTVMGLATAWVLVRYRFPGKRLLNAVVDLPLAIPSLVTGIMLVVLYGPQEAIGGWLKETLGIPIIFAPPGIVLALLFVTFPFVIRTIQPVLLSLNRVQEDAAAVLGAPSWTIFRRVIFPYLRKPLLAGGLLSFARALGEFGAIVVVAGNIPFYSQTAAVYVFGEVESENRMGASAVSIVMIGIALIMVLLVNYLQRKSGEERS